MAGLRFIAFAAALLLPAAAVAKTSDLAPEQEQRAAHLYGELKCPVCKNQSLAASSSFLAEEMKAQIRDFVAEGKSDTEIIDYYLTRYGDWILLRPRAKGFGLLAWLVPAVLVALGAGVVVLRLRRGAAADATALASVSGAAPHPTVPHAYQKRIERLIEEEPQSYE